MFDWDTDYDELVTHGQKDTATVPDVRKPWFGDGISATDRIVPMLCILCVAVIALFPSKSGIASGSVVAFAVTSPLMLAVERDDLSMPDGLRTYTYAEFRSFISNVAQLGDADLTAYARITADDIAHAGVGWASDAFHDVMTLLQLEKARRGLNVIFPAPPVETGAFIPVPDLQIQG
ncbi:hypothetical protein [Roseinatronobacter sp. S2]|uniref:hypothetical protein n=1 Tax=Roseinatronobacter sp. S2 TaxID=3035471 RepID=UPI002410A03F|nr:hypothetical protein [Roseinatronobacter sp. S2]WFE75482.1 hypothetical protein P8S53_03480 [Roseinatronobacter sp. S2]